MKYLMGLVIMLTGCVAPPINITQDSRDAQEAIAPVVVVIYHSGGTVKDNKAQVTQSVKPPIVRSIETPSTKRGCPPFELPGLPEVPNLPWIDPDRSNDYEYLSGVLLDHIETLIEHNAGVRSAYAEAYDQYVSRCELTVD